MVQKLILVIKKYFCVENISPYNISYKASTGPKPFCIKFDKIDGFIISLDGKIKHLVLFDYGLSDEICDKIKYLISQKSATTNRINYNFEKIKTDSYNSLPIKKNIDCYNTHNVTILIKSVVNKNENKYYYNIFLEKGSYKYKFQ